MDTFEIKRWRSLLPQRSQLPLTSAFILRKNNASLAPQALQ
jgi:hypothetical protein